MALTDLMRGDNLSCWNAEECAWCEVEVIDVDEGRVRVVWVGDNDLDPLWLPAESSRLSIRHKKGVCSVCTLSTLGDADEESIELLEHRIHTNSLTGTMTINQ